MAPKIDTITASAGAGKTTRVVKEIATEVETRPPEEIVATTFTVKAADELIERARASLFTGNQADKAVRLLGARFGTVNSVCGQIVSEHAFELGRSPRSEVISEDSVNRILRIAASDVFTKHAQALNGISDHFGYFEPSFFEAPDWRTTIQDLIDLARANGISADQLTQSADKSVESFVALLSATPPGATAESLDADLQQAVTAALAKPLAAPGAEAKKAIEALKNASGKFQRKEHLSWPEWAKLTKLKYAKKDGADFANAIEDVKTAASKHICHPRLRSECAIFIRTLFQCAAESMAAYADYKAARGLIDFTDQEMLALSVIADKDMRGRLSERISRVFVDEFQDSSPLQIAIFTSLAEIVESSTWVGDPKQAIYGFRNADTALTQAAFLGAGKGTKPGDPLRKSYRSRPAIVDFVNAAFEPSLAAMGLPAADHRFSGTERTDKGFGKSSLGVWRLPGPAEEQFVSLAAGVKTALDNAADWIVDGRHDGGMRPLALRDIAVLCRSKADVGAVAAAIAKIGLPVAVERDELARTSHVELVLAALRWVADQTDRLALAELARFFADDPTSDAWLQAVGAENMDEALKAANPISGDLEKLREQLLELTPAEMVDAVMMLPALLSRIERWGHHAIRLDDLEALRGFARTYESECTGSGEPATLSGLLLSFGESETKRPKSLAPDAIKVMTYHAAKGLEWPLVILTGLAKEPKARLYEPVAEVEGDLDWMNPLSGRWIRYWPWPYGSQSKDVGLDISAANSDLGKLALKRAREEETRLLYVGLTRARDYAILAPAIKRGTAWLNVLDTGAAEIGYVKLPVGNGEPISAGAIKLTADVINLNAPAEDGTTVEALPTYIRLERPPVERQPLFKRPSKAVTEAKFKVVNRIELGKRIAIVGDVNMETVGHAVHAVLAADRTGVDRAKRLAMAKGILERWGIKQVDADHILAASDALHEHIGKTWSQAKTMIELPVAARIGDQMVNGRIDLLVEHAGGYAIIDHKSFPGARDQLDEKAISYGPQLSHYSEAIELATGRKITNLLVHLPIVGKLYEVARA